MEIVADVAGSVQLGWGAWLLNTGHWIYGQWELEVFAVMNPTIDFLELYALRIAVIMWAPFLMDKVVLL